MPTTQVIRPEAGQTTTVRIDSDNMRLSLGFEPDPNAVAKNGQDLEFTFEDGGKVVLEGYYDHFASKTLPVMVLESGDELEGEDFLASLREDLLTAAGPGAGAGAPGGGAGDYSDDAGSLIDGIGRLGSLGTIYWGYDSEVPEEYSGVFEGAGTPSLGPDMSLVVSTDVDGTIYTGAFEDGRPFQHVGDQTDYLAQLTFVLNPAPDTSITTVYMSGFPAGTIIYLGQPPVEYQVIGEGDVLELTMEQIESGVFLRPPHDTDLDMFDITTTVDIVHDISGVQVNVPGPGLTVIVDAAADKPEMNGGDGFVTPDLEGSISISENEDRVQDLRDGWATDDLSKSSETVITDPTAVRVSVDFHTTIRFGDYLDGSESHYALVEVPGIGSWSPVVNAPAGVSFVDTIVLYFDADGKCLGSKEVEGAVSSKEFFRFEVSNDALAETGGVVDLDVTFTSTNTGILRDTTITLETGAMAVENEEDASKELWLGNNESYTFNNEAGQTGLDAPNFVIDTIDSQLSVRVGWASEDNDNSQHVHGSYSPNYAGMNDHHPTDGNVPGVDANSTTVNGAPIIFSISGSAGESMDSIKLFFDPESGSILINGVAQTPVQDANGNWYVELSAGNGIAADGLSTSGVTFLPGIAHSDIDVPMGYEVSVSSGAGASAVYTGNTIVIIDAVADLPTNVDATLDDGSSHLTVTGEYPSVVSETTPNQPGEDGWERDTLNAYQTVAGRQISLNLSANFADTDGSENHYILVQLPSGWSFDEGSLAAVGLTLTGQTYTDDNGNVYQMLQLASNVGEFNSAVLVNMPTYADLVSDQSFTILTGAMAVETVGGSLEYDMANNQAVELNEQPITILADVVNAQLNIQVGWASEGNNDAKHLDAGNQSSDQYKYEGREAGATGTTEAGGEGLNLGAPIRFALGEGSAQTSGETITNVVLTLAGADAENLNIKPDGSMVIRLADGTEIVLDWDGPDAAGLYTATLSAGQDYVDTDGNPVTLPDDLAGLLNGSQGDAVGLFFRPAEGSTSDIDLDLGYRVTVDNGAGSQLDFTGEATIVIDAVADMPTFAVSETEDDILSSTGSFNEPAANGDKYQSTIKDGWETDSYAANQQSTVTEKFTFEVSANFPDYDGSETHYILIQLGTFTQADGEEWAYPDAKTLADMGLKYVGQYEHNGVTYDRFEIDPAFEQNGDFSATITVESSGAQLTADATCTVVTGAMAVEKAEGTAEYDKDDGTGTAHNNEAVYINTDNPITLTADVVESGLTVKVGWASEGNDNSQHVSGSYSPDYAGMGVDANSTSVNGAPIIFALDQSTVTGEDKESISEVTLKFSGDTPGMLVIVGPNGSLDVSDLYDPATGTYTLSEAAISEIDGSFFDADFTFADLLAGSVTNATGLFFQPTDTNFDGDVTMTYNVTVVNGAGSEFVFNGTSGVVIDAVADKPLVDADDPTANLSEITISEGKTVDGENGETTQTARDQDIKDGWATDTFGKAEGRDTTGDEAGGVVENANTITATFTSKITFDDFDGSETHTAYMQVPVGGGGETWTLNEAAFNGQTGLSLYYEEGSTTPKTVTLYFHTDAAGNRTVIGEGAEPANWENLKVDPSYTSAEFYVIMVDEGVLEKAGGILDVVAEFSSKVWNDTTVEVELVAKATDTETTSSGYDLENNVSYTLAGKTEANGDGQDGGSYTPPSFSVDTIDSTLELKVGWASEDNNNAQHKAGYTPEVDGKTGQYAMYDPADGYGIDTGSTKAAGAPISLSIDGADEGITTVSFTLPGGKLQSNGNPIEADGSIGDWKVEISGDTVTFTFTGKGTAPANLDSLNLTVVPTEANSDGDIKISYEVTVESSAGASATYSGTTVAVVDAVADMPTDVDIKATAPVVEGKYDSGEALKPGETTTIKGSTTFADNDGSESHFVVISLPSDSAWSFAGDTSSATLLNQTTIYNYWREAAIGVEPVDKNSDEHAAWKVKVDQFDGAMQDILAADGSSYLLLETYSTDDGATWQYRINGVDVDPKDLPDFLNSISFVDGEFSYSLNIVAPDMGSPAMNQEDSEGYDSVTLHTKGVSVETAPSEGEYDYANNISVNEAYTNGTGGTGDPNDPNNPKDTIIIEAAGVTSNIDVKTIPVYEDGNANKHGAVEGDKNYVKQGDTEGRIVLKHTGPDAENEIVDSITLELTGETAKYGDIVIDGVNYGDKVTLTFTVNDAGRYTRVTVTGANGIENTISAGSYARTFDNFVEQKIQPTYVPNGEKTFNDLDVAIKVTANIVEPKSGAAESNVKGDGFDDQGVGSILVDAVADKPQATGGTTDYTQHDEARPGHGMEAGERTAAVPGDKITLNVTTTFKDLDSSETHHILVKVPGDILLDSKYDANKLSADDIAALNKLGAGLDADGTYYQFNVGDDSPNSLSYVVVNGVNTGVVNLALDAQIKENITLGDDGDKAISLDVIAWAHETEEAVGKELTTVNNDAFDRGNITVEVATVGKIDPKGSIAFEDHLPFQYHKDHQGDAADTAGGKISFNLEDKGEVVDQLTLTFTGNLASQGFLEYGTGTLGAGAERNVPWSETIVVNGVSSTVTYLYDGVNTTITITNYQDGALRYSGNPNNDYDASFTWEMKVRDPSSGAQHTFTSANDGGPILVEVDAVADLAQGVGVEANEGGKLVTYKDGHTKAGSEEEVAFTVKGTFGDFADGSEVHTVWVQIPAGWTVSENFAYDYTTTTLNGKTYLVINVDNQFNLVETNGLVTIEVKLVTPPQSTGHPGDESVNLDIKFVSDERNFTDDHDKYGKEYDGHTGYAEHVPGEDNNHAEASTSVTINVGRVKDIDLQAAGGRVFENDQPYNYKEGVASKDAFDNDSTAAKGTPVIITVDGLNTGGDDYVSQVTIVIQETPGELAGATWTADGSRGYFIYNEQKYVPDADGKVTILLGENDPPFDGSKLTFIPSGHESGWLNLDITVRVSDAGSTEFKDFNTDVKVAVDAVANRSDVVTSEYSNSGAPLHISSLASKVSEFPVSTKFTDNDGSEYHYILIEQKVDWAGDYEVKYYNLDGQGSIPYFKVPVPTMPGPDGKGDQHHLSTEEYNQLLGAERGTPVDFPDRGVTITLTEDGTWEVTVIARLDPDNATGSGSLKTGSLAEEHNITDSSEAHTSPHDVNNVALRPGDELHYQISNADGISIGTDFIYEANWGEYDQHGAWATPNYKAPNGHIRITPNDGTNDEFRSTMTITLTVAEAGGERALQPGECELYFDGNKLSQGDNIVLLQTHGGGTVQGTITVHDDGTITVTSSTGSFKEVDLEIRHSGTNFNDSDINVLVNGTVADTRDPDPSHAADFTAKGTVVVDAVAQAPLVDTNTVVEPKYADVGAPGDGDKRLDLGEKALTTFKITFPDTDGSEIHYILLEAIPGIQYNGSEAWGMESRTYTDENGQVVTKNYFKIPLDSGDPSQDAKVTWNGNEATIEIAISIDGVRYIHGSQQFDLSYGAMSYDKNTTGGEKHYSNNFAYTWGGKFTLDVDMDHTGGPDPIDASIAFENNFEYYCRVNEAGEVIEVVKECAVTIHEPVTIEYKGNENIVIIVNGREYGPGTPVSVNQGDNVIIRLPENYKDDDFNLHWTRPAGGSGDERVYVDAVAQVSGKTMGTVISGAEHEDYPGIRWNGDGNATINVKAQFLDVDPNDGSTVHYMLVEALPGWECVGGEMVSIDGVSYFRVPVPAGNIGPDGSASLDITIRTPDGLNVFDGQHLKTGTMSVEKNLSGGEWTYDNNVAYRIDKDGVTLYKSVADPRLQLTTTIGKEVNTGDEWSKLTFTGIEANDRLTNLELKVNANEGEFRYGTEALTDGTHTYGPIKIVVSTVDTPDGPVTTLTITSVDGKGLTEGELAALNGKLGLATAPGYESNKDINISWDYTVTDTLSGDTGGKSHNKTVIIDAVARQPVAGEVELEYPDGREGAAQLGDVVKAKGSVTFVNIEEETPYVLVQYKPGWEVTGVTLTINGESFVFSAAEVKAMALFYPSGNMSGGAYFQIPLPPYNDPNHPDYDSLATLRAYMNGLAEGESFTVSVEAGVRIPDNSINSDDGFGFNLGGVAYDSYTDGEKYLSDNVASGIQGKDIDVGIVESTPTPQPENPDYIGVGLGTEGGEITLDFSGMVDLGHGESITSVTFTVPAGCTVTVGSTTYNAGNSVTVNAQQIADGVTLATTDQYNSGKFDLNSMSVTVKDVSGATETFSDLSGSVFIQGMASGASMNDVGTGIGALKESKEHGPATTTLSLSGTFEDSVGEDHFFYVEAGKGLTLSSTYGPKSVEGLEGQWYVVPANGAGTASVTATVLKGDGADFTVKVYAGSVQTADLGSDSVKSFVNTVDPAVVTINRSSIDFNLDPTSSTTETNPGTVEYTVDDLANGDVELNLITLAKLADADGDKLTLTAFDGVPLGEGETYWEVEFGDNGAILKVYKDGSAVLTGASADDIGSANFSLTVTDLTAAKAVTGYVEISLTEVVNTAPTGVAVSSEITSLNAEALTGYLSELFYDKDGHDVTATTVTLTGGVTVDLSEVTTSTTIKDGNGGELVITRDGEDFSYEYLPGSAAITGKVSFSVTGVDEKGAESESAGTLNITYKGLTLASGENVNGDEWTESATISGVGGNEITSGSGADKITLTGEGSTLNAGDGNDIINLSGSGHTVHGGAGADKITGTNANGSIYGDEGDDYIDVYGAAKIFGGDGNDTIIGHGGAIINGGQGSDKLSGGYGDIFEWTASDLSSGATDTLLDFSLEEGDKLALAGLLDTDSTTVTDTGLSLVLTDGDTTQNLTVQFASGDTAFKEFTTEYNSYAGDNDVQQALVADLIAKMTGNS